MVEFEVDRTDFFFFSDRYANGVGHVQRDGNHDGAGRCRGWIFDVWRERVWERDVFAERDALQEWVGRGRMMRRCGDGGKVGT